MYRGKIYDSIDALAQALGVGVGELLYCMDNMDNMVHAKITHKKDGSPRRLVAPTKRLKDLQRKVKDLFFAEYEFPGYVYGLGKNTLAQHARLHAGKKQLVQVDLRDFFPSIDNEKVYRMWAVVFRQPPTISRVLTRLTTQASRLQQGFPTSSHIAAVVAMPMTGSIQSYCESNGLGFSQYVDDLNLSGIKIDHAQLFKLLVCAARRSGFSIKPRKTKVTNSRTGKIITGVSLFGTRVRTPRATRRRAIDALKALSANPSDASARKRAYGYARHMLGLSREEGANYLRKVRAVSRA
jgi:RNA-directed DNA polymerase